MEEVCVEEGFRAADPRFAIGVALEALVRVTRLTCSIGLHTGAMDVAEATERFVRDAHLARTGAASEARRGTFDATYGRYTWGKLELLRLREEARTAWGTGFTPERFHRAPAVAGQPAARPGRRGADRGLSTGRPGQGQYGRGRQPCCGAAE